MIFDPRGEIEVPSPLDGLELRKLKTPQEAIELESALTVYSFAKFDDPRFEMARMTITEYVVSCGNTIRDESMEEQAIVHIRIEDTIMKLMDMWTWVHSAVFHGEEFLQEIPCRPCPILVDNNVRQNIETTIRDWRAAVYSETNPDSQMNTDEWILSRYAALPKREIRNWLFQGVEKPF